MNTVFVTVKKLLITNFVYMIFRFIILAVIIQQAGSAAAIRQLYLQNRQVSSSM